MSMKHADLLAYLMRKDVKITNLSIIQKIYIANNNIISYREMSRILRNEYCLTLLFY